MRRKIKTEETKETDNVVYVCFGRSKNESVPKIRHVDDVVIELFTEKNGWPIKLEETKYYTNYFGDEVS